MRPSSRLILLQDDSVALIRRVRENQTYYTFPGGGVEPGETPEQAAAREAMEELGLQVRPERLVATNIFRGNPQQYFLATILGGEFGTGTGEEFTSPAKSERGSYEPIWLKLTELGQRDIRPGWLAAALIDGSLLNRTEPLAMIEN